MLHVQPRLGFYARLYARSDIAPGAGNFIGDQLARLGLQAVTDDVTDTYHNLPTEIGADWCFSARLSIVSCRSCGTAFAVPLFTLAYVDMRAYLILH
jgi:hypothetical protein